MMINGENEEEREKKKNKRLKKIRIKYSRVSFQTPRNRTCPTTGGSFVRLPPPPSLFLSLSFVTRFPSPPIRTYRKPINQKKQNSHFLISTDRPLYPKKRERKGSKIISWSASPGRRARASTWARGSGVAGRVLPDIAKVTHVGGIAN